MDNNNLNYQRRCAVSKAWMNERQQVMNSRGSRNWTQKEQKEILKTGKCHGYEGQHMLSVKAHPEHAGNEKNIQFLTHKEHFQAHGGNWKNDANGKYNLRTGKVEAFSNGEPNVKYRKLSDPLSDCSKKIADNQYQKIIAKQKNVSNKSEVKDKLPVRKSTYNETQNKYASSRELFNSKTSSSKSSKDVRSNNSGQKSSNVSKGNAQGMS